MLEQIAEAMLAARAALLEQFNKLHKTVLKIVRQDEVCRRFMTTPSVGAIVAITYKSALDDPGRIKKVPKRRSALWIDAEAIPIGRNRCDRWDITRGRRDGSYSPLRGGECVALPGHTLLGAQALRTGGGQAARYEARQGRRLAQAGGDPASHLKLEEVDIPVRKQLHSRNRRIDHVYFPESGIASVVANGPHALEIGIIGREGMTGSW